MLSKRLCAYTEDNTLGGLLVKRSNPAVEEKCKLMVGKTEDSVYARSGNIGRRESCIIHRDTQTTTNSPLPT